MGLLKRSEKTNYSRPRLGKPYISTPVLVLVGISSAIFLTYNMAEVFNERVAVAMRQYFLMPTDYAAFSKRPWTILTSLFFHENILAFVANVLGILVFGNLTAMLFNKRIVAPLFIAGGLIASVSIWVFKYIPLTQEMLQNTFVGGASGGVMTLAMLASFYMPEQIVRLYGVYPLKLKFIGRALLLFSVVALFFEHDPATNILNLGGALGGYVFLVLIRRNKLVAAPIPFFGARKKVWKSAKVEMKVIHNKPLSDEEFNDIRISQKEYLDHLLDKISRDGVNSLSRSEMDFLNRYGKE